jgi:large subunit ribosomal protein L10
MAHELKEMMLRELEDQFHDIRQAGCVVLTYQGLSADKARDVREQVRRAGGRMTVVRNRLFSLAAERLGAGGVAELMEGPSAVVCAENAVVAAKAAQDVARGSDAITIRGAYVDGRVLGPDGVEKLSKVPSREELLSMFVGMLMAPARRLVGGLLAKPRELLSVFQQLKDRADQQG